MKKPWFTQPLLHFLLLGGAIFALHEWLREADPEISSRRIEISAEEIERLAGEEERRRGVPPNRDQLASLIATRIEEEVLYREALDLGLNQGDVIIRRRLVQKMRFLAEDLARPEAPSQGALKLFFEARRDGYQLPTRLSFSHVYFHRGSEAKARQGLERLRAGADPSEMGDRFMLSHSYARHSPREIAALFGAAFAEAVFEIDAGRWRGPIESSFGLHLVRVSLRQDARRLEFEEARERIAADYLAEQTEQANRRYHEELREAYDVRVDWPDGLRVGTAGTAAGGRP